MAIEERMVVLESDVGHIKSDVAEMKIDIREMRHDIVGLKDSVGALRVDMVQGDASLRAEMHTGFADMRSAIASAKMWAIWLYIGLGVGLFGTMAGGFMWMVKELRP